jgi:GTP cyclohydrolase I
MDLDTKNFRQQIIEADIQMALIELGKLYPEYDPSDMHNVDTPKRIAKMWIEMFRGLGEPDFEFTVFPNESDSYCNWIIERDIEFSSMCAHHFMPFMGVVHIGYVPDEIICGLSKLPRVVDYFAARPQVQERLGEDILNYLYMNLKPKKIAIIIESKHTCVGCRGIKSRNAETMTTHSYNYNDLLQFKELLKKG